MTHMEILLAITALGAVVYAGLATWLYCEQENLIKQQRLHIEQLEACICDKPHDGADG